MTKIIIVEDDPMISEIYQRKFSESGFDVLTAMSGEQVLDILKDNGDVDVIMTDLMMPKMDGFELIKALREGDYNKDIKIIVSSNLSQREDQDKALKLGANGFISKAEYAPSDLVKEVQRLMGQFQEQRKNQARAEMLEKNRQPSSGAKKILMIEDEDIFIEMFGDKLKSEGYKVSAASNGAWGVKEALSGDYDLFVIDMIMPAMTGEEIVGRLKLDDKTKNTPIIIFSASVEDEMAKRVEAMGIDAFFVKTQITPGDLSKKVNEILGK